jgi:hypothetical protein
LIRLGGGGGEKKRKRWWWRRRRRREEGGEERRKKTSEDGVFFGVGALDEPNDGTRKNSSGKRTKTTTPTYCAPLLPPPHLPLHIRTHIQSNE